MKIPDLVDRRGTLCTVERALRHIVTRGSDWVPGCLTGSPDLICTSLSPPTFPPSGVSFFFCTYLALFALD